MTRPLISVCIPAYNRTDELGHLIDSIVAQSMDDWEIVICEDGSPQRERIRDVAARYEATLGARLRYHEKIGRAHV